MYTIQLWAMLTCALRAYDKLPKNRNIAFIYDMKSYSAISHTTRQIQAKHQNVLIFL
jgi:hypothetical protein